MTEQNRPPAAPGNQNNQSSRPPQRHHHSNNRPKGHHPNRNRHQQRPHNNHQQKQRNPNSNIDQLLMHYDRLVEQHIDARKKFFELYYRVDYNRRDKLEDQFYLTSQNLIRFQRELQPWQLKELRKNRTDIYSIDNIYSSSHPEGENLPMNAAVSEAHYHLTPTQVSRPSYKEDVEQTTGTMDDYLAYKSSKN